MRGYNHLNLVYPNNPYVASAYAAFLSDIACDERETNEVAKVYRHLRAGMRTRIELSYFFAIRFIQLFQIKMFTKHWYKPNQSDIMLDLYVFPYLLPIIIIMIWPTKMKNDLNFKSR